MTKIVGLFCVVAYLLCGCTLNKTPSNRTTFDGLELVKSNGKQQQVWAYPGVDLSSYKSIVFRGAGIQFRPAKRTSLLRPDQTDFFISEENRQRLLQIVTEEFREELIKVSGFSVINEPEPDSLLLIISLIDVVSHVPERPKRNTIFLSDAGAVVLPGFNGLFHIDLLAAFQKQQD